MHGVSFTVFTNGSFKPKSTPTDTLTITATVDESNFRPNYDEEGLDSYYGLI